MSTIYKILIFFSQTEKEDMVRKSTNLLLTRTLSGCLATLIKRPGLGLLQLIQITINTYHLEHANVLLENFVARLTGYVLLVVFFFFIIDKSLLSIEMIIMIFL